MKVEEPSIVHDVLWLFNCSLSEHPVQQMAAKVKAEAKGQKNSKVLKYIGCQFCIKRIFCSARFFL